MPWEIVAGGGPVEVADRVWLARLEYLDVNVGIVAGDRGLLVLDTTASAHHARALVADLRRLSRGPVVAVVNTHQHFDHVLGNATLRAAYPEADLLAHEEAARLLPGHVEEVRAQVADAADEPHAAEILASEVLVPDRTFSSAAAVDLGDRLVEVLHLGRGHTAGDAVAVVADAAVAFAGDLVEQSGPPGFGGDCYPLEWPATLDLLIGLLDDTSVVLPGHGLPVDRGFVVDQRDAVGAVAETVRVLAERGRPVESMLAEGDWPYPTDALTDAVRRAAAHLPRSARRLPLA